MSDDRLTPKLPDKIEKALRAFARAKDPAAKIRLHASLVSAILAAMEEARRGAIEEAKGVCGDLMLLPFPGYRSALAEAVRRIGALSLPQSPAVEVCGLACPDYDRAAGDCRRFQGAAESPADPICDERRSDRGAAPQTPAPTGEPSLKVNVARCKEIRETTGCEGVACPECPASAPPTTPEGEEGAP
jgi:hypothetical protein